MRTTDEQIDEARPMATRRFESYRELGDYVGVSKQAVHQAVKSGGRLRGVDLRPYILRENGSVVGFEIPAAVGFGDDDAAAAGQSSAAGVNDQSSIDDQLDGVDMRGNPSAENIEIRRLEHELETKRWKAERADERWGHLAGIGERAAAAAIENPALMHGAVEMSKLLLPIAVGMAAGYLAASKTENAAVIIGCGGAAGLLTDGLTRREKSLLALLFRPQAEFTRSAVGDAGGTEPAYRRNPGGNDQESPVADGFGRSAVDDPGRSGGESSTAEPAQRPNGEGGGLERPAADRSADEPPDFAIESSAELSQRPLPGGDGLESMGIDGLDLDVPLP